MKTTVYITTKGRLVAPGRAYAFSVTLEEYKPLHVEYWTERGLQAKGEFNWWKQVQEFITKHNGPTVFPQYLHLRLCYSDNKLTPATNEDCVYYVEPATAHGYKAVFVGNGEPKELGFGTMEQALGAIKKSGPQRRTRNAPHTVRQMYYDTQARYIGEYLRGNAAYKVHEMSNGKWRVSKVSETGRRTASLITDTEFFKEEDALEFLYEYVGVAEKEPENVESYYTETLDACADDSAAYKLVDSIPGTFSKAYKKNANGTWDYLMAGEPRDILKSLKPAPAPVPAKATGQKNIVDLVWARVEGTTYLNREQLRDYLESCMMRNRAIGKTPVIDTHLCDMLEQPVYVVDTDLQGGCSRDISCLRLAMSLSEVHTTYPDIETMPDPLLWCNNPADLIWNPSFPVQHITRRCFEHVCIERADRLPEELRNVKPVVLMGVLQQSLMLGAARANRDPYYALPAYSFKHNEVSMLLPVQVPFNYGEKVVAAFVMAKGLTGYWLATIITTKMAKRNVRVFRDPDQTWLKEC